MLRSGGISFNLEANAANSITACNAPLFLGAASVEHHMQQPLEPHPSAFGNRVPVQYGSYQMGDQQGTINNMPNIDIASPVEAFSSATTAPTFGSMYNLHAQTTFVPINGVGVVSNSGRYPCTYPGCDQSVKSAGDLGRHMKEHEDGPKEFECPIRDCPRQGEKGFARKDKMKDHLKSRHKLSSL